LRVQVTLVEVLAEVRRLASEPLAGEVEARSEVVEGLPVVVAPSDNRAEHRGEGVSWDPEPVGPGAVFGALVE
jgi:hypothetical protein